MQSTETASTIPVMMKRLFILASLTLGGLLLTSLVMALLPGTGTTRIMRVITVVQDMFVFIVPALGLAVIASRNAVEFMSIGRGPSIWQLVTSIAILIVSAPLQDVIISWNESWQLPSALARTMNEAEERARIATELILGGTEIRDLVLGLLITGIFAALAEELYFRGALQRLLAGNRQYSHAAVWIAATIFSLFHFQVYGFVPRLLLGAYFGYLVWWTRSLWVPIIVHACNNGVVVTSEWMARRTGDPLDALSAGNPWIVAVSAFMTGLGIWTLYTLTHRKVFVKKL